MNSINLIIILLLILSITYCLYHTNEVKINKSVTKQESINNESIKKSGELETSKILVDNKLESLEKEKQNLEKKLSSLKDAENVLKELQVKDDSCGCDRDDGLVPLNSTASLLDKFSEENVNTIIEGFDNYSQEYLLEVRKQLERTLEKRDKELEAAKEQIKKLKRQISFVQGL